MIALREMLRRGGELLRDVSEAPELEALVLLEESTSLSRTHLFAHPESSLTEERAAEFFTLIERRRRERLPLAYLTGRREFFSLQFSVTRDVFIPRPETELLVEEGLDYLSTLPSQASPRVLDIGTGSGAIIVALRKHYTGRGLFFATDIARESLSVARKNAIDNGVADILFLQAPFFDAFAPGQRFDLILSNPPYIDRGGESLLPPEVLTEPDRALFSAERGLYHIRKILRLAPGYLKPGGRLLMDRTHLYPGSLGKDPLHPYGPSVILPPFLTEPQGVWYFIL